MTAREDQRGLQPNKCLICKGAIYTEHPPERFCTRCVVNDYTSYFLMGEKLATEDQPQKLPIDRPCSACSAGDYEMEYHDHHPPFSKRGDHPRPTPPDCQKDSNLITAPGKDFTGEMTIGEAQGEAPQVDTLPKGIAVNQPSFCEECKSYAGRHAAWCPFADPSKELPRVETGAHPSQDAQQFWYPIALKIVRGAYEHSHRPILGNADEVEAQMLAHMLAKHAAGARSAPSPDPPPPEEK